MYVKEYGFRYSDVDSSGDVKLSTILDLLQDISIEHAASVGLDTARFKAEHLACLLASWRVQFVKKLDCYEKVTIKTGLMNVSKCDANRKYEIWQNGECKIIATATWFTVSTDNMRIVRITEELFSAFESITEEDNNLPCLKLRPVGDVPLIDKTKVSKRDLDTNNHLNNVKAVEIALNALPEDFAVSELQVKYRKELKLNEAVKIYGTQSQDGFYMEIRNEAEQSCILVNVIK